jgi:fatty-acyl-CoA synthase
VSDSLRYDVQHGWLTRDAVARQAQLRPGRTAIVEQATERELTYAGLEAEVRRCEALLRSLVRGKAARIALLARNSAYHPILFYAAARAGAVFVPLNWRLKGAELAAVLEDAEPEVLIYELEFEALAAAALARAPGAIVLRIGRGGDELAEAMARQQPTTPGRIAPCAPSMLLYTSGTTGRPKGVIVTPRSAFFAAMNFAYAHDFTARHAQVCDVPLFHVVGALAVMHATLLSGGRLHLSDRFEPAATLALLGDRSLAISHYFCVPQMAQALADHPGFAETNLIGLGIFTGGAPTPVSLTQRLTEAGLLPASGYGMSEAGTVLGMPMDAGAALLKAGSAGVPAPAVEVRLVGADGQDAPAGEIGEIWLRGPAITPGYWNQPDANAAAFVDGWFRTGDAARRDADGFYFIVDRWKDMYISGGENVYPAEVEAVIADLEAVAEVAVVGLPDARWGERGCAFVVVREGAACTAEAVQAWCGERLAGYKLPSEVCFVAALPRTGSGKVRKHELRRSYQARRLA